MSKRDIFVPAYAALLLAVMFYSAYGFYRTWIVTGSPRLGWLGGLIGTLPVIWVASLSSLRGDQSCALAGSRTLPTLALLGALLASVCWVTGETPNLNPLTNAWLALVGLLAYRHLMITADVPESDCGS